MFRTTPVFGSRLTASWIVVLALGLAVAGIQIFSGAYQAEFTGHPDEAGQFVSGLMVYDYLTQLPSGNPVAWAAKYYLHYPQIAIGRWPPGFAISEAIWWLVWRPSRWSALALTGTFVWIASVVFYRLARRVASPLMALAASLLLIAAPVTSFSFSTAMADAPCLLASVLILDAAVRLLEGRRTGLVWRFGAILLAALLIKGTALCLLPVPVIACLAAYPAIADKDRLRYGMGIFALAGVGVFVILYLAFPCWFYYLRAISGASLAVPWSGPLALHLVGYGFDLLAAIGMWFALAHRRPVAVAAASTALSILLVSAVLRAMLEPRHWIILIPAILLLALESVSGIATTRLRLATVCLVALAFFPFQLWRQHPDGYAAIAAKIPLPSRMLISSTASGEGPTIAAIALREHFTRQRTASVVMRGTKVLASMGWNGEDYRLLVHSPAEVLTRLDELGIDVVVVHSSEGEVVPPHQGLLLAALSGSAWRPVETGVASFREWRRGAPSTVPRKPLEIDLNNTFFRTIHE